jgi:CHAT domain-containing protein
MRAAAILYFLGENEKSKLVHEYCLKHNKYSLLDTEIKCRIMNNLACNYMDEEKYNESFNLLYSSIDSLQKILNSDDKMLFTTKGLLLSELYDNLGEQNFIIGNPTESDNWTRKSICLRLSILKSKDKLFTNQQYRHLIESYMRLFTIKQLNNSTLYLDTAIYYASLLSAKSFTIDARVTLFQVLLMRLNLQIESGDQESVRSSFDKLRFDFQKDVLQNDHLKFLFKIAELRYTLKFNKNDDVIEELKKFHYAWYCEDKISFKELQIYFEFICWINKMYKSEDIQYYNILSDVFDFMIKKNVQFFNLAYEYKGSRFNEEYYLNKIFFISTSIFSEYAQISKVNYNSILRLKGMLLESKLSAENYYRDISELYSELNFRNKLLSKMESEGSTDKDRLEKLRKEADSLDKRLTLSWPEYAQQKKNMSITWDQVQQNLDQGEAAIEFVRFKNEDDSLYYYNALVLKKGDSNPTLIKLCKEEELTAITPKMGYSAYYPLIWQPLESALDGIKTIYYAPSGELYTVPFHALYAPKGKGDEVLASKTDKRGVIIQNEKATTEQNAEYLMDRYTLHQLTSTRYLAMGLKQKEKEKIGNNMAMVGGLNYDYLPGSQSATTKTKKNKNASRSSQSASGKLSYLEGTETEVSLIKDSINRQNWKYELLDGEKATEENLTRLEGKHAKSILHLATHGYAFPEYDFNDTTISKNSLRYSYRYSTNPMVRSGLILTGGNWAWTGSDTLTKLGAEQNGILTALEVSQLNLKKTKLVVLSACETGLGKIEGSEGTFGLKRGFKLAGVEQMIVSLWSVPDKETMELMTLFYSDLTKSLNPVTSFEKAQKEMRNKYPTDPEKWAGFVLVR